MTLFVYLAATALSGFAWDFKSYMVFRALTGAGIGGEYAAINSAIDELIPARLRGQVDLAINATFWVGAMMGSALSLVFLNTQHFPLWLGWRLVFGTGALLGLVVLIFRRWVPESPRWLMVHGNVKAAEQIVADVEKQAYAGKVPGPPPEPKTIIHVRGHTTFAEIWNAIAHQHRSRAFLGLGLMASQAFFFNAIFFSYALVLSKFYHVPANGVGAYLLPIAFGNAIGPIVMGRLFDTFGRKPMIVITYGASGLLLAISAWLFEQNLLTLDSQSLAWTIIFFIASAAASSAYLTVSEIFPLEIRALAIAIFYAIGTLVGGVAAPTIFGYLIGTGSREMLAAGYGTCALFMMGGAALEAWIGVKAERQSLESIAAPLSATAK